MFWSRSGNQPARQLSAQQSRGVPTLIRRPLGRVLIPALLASSLGVGLAPAAHAATRPSSQAAARTGVSAPAPMGGKSSTTLPSRRPKPAPQVGSGAAAAKGQGPAKHCVGSAVTGKATCYTTFREAISKATGGRVNDAPIAAAQLSPAQVTKLNTTQARTMKGGMTALTATEPAGVLEIDYTDANFGGSTFTWNGQDCRAMGSSSFQFVDNLQALGWGDRISSFQSFNHCYSTHYWDANRSGPSFTRHASDPMSYVGDTWNDQISSIRWDNGPTNAYTLRQAEAFDTQSSNTAAMATTDPDGGGSQVYADYLSGNPDFWVGYYGVDFGAAPAQRFIARLSAVTPRSPQNGRIDVRVDSLTSAPVASIPGPRQSREGRVIWVGLRHAGEVAVRA